MSGFCYVYKPIYAKAISKLNFSKFYFILLLLDTHNTLQNNANSSLLPFVKYI